MTLDDGCGDVEWVSPLDFMKNIHHPHLTGLSGIWRSTDALILAMELGDRTLMECLRDSQAQGLPGIAPDLLHEYMREVAKGRSPPELAPDHPPRPQAEEPPVNERRGEGLRFLPAEDPGAEPCVHQRGDDPLLCRA